LPAEEAQPINLKEGTAVDKVPGNTILSIANNSLAVDDSFGACVFLSFDFGATEEVNNVESFENEIAKWWSIWNTFR
jgi:hypothetical protein